MEMDGISVFNLKLKTLLDRILDSQLPVKDDRNMNMLLSYLSGKDNTDLGETLLNLPLLVDWVQKVIQCYENSETTSYPSADLIPFALNLTALLVKSEYRFYLLSSNDCITRLCRIFNLEESSNPSKKLAFVKLLSALTSHKPGLSWLLSSQLWKEVVALCFTTETVYVQREVYKFTYNFLVSTAEVCEHFCSIATMQILSHLIDTNLNGTINGNSGKHSEKGQLIATTKIAIHVLESFIQDKKFEKLKFVAIFMKDSNLEQVVSNFLAVETDPELYHQFAHLLLVIHHLNVILEKDSATIKTAEVRKLFLNVLQILVNHMNTCGIDARLALCYNGEMYLSILYPYLPSLEEMKTNKCDMSLLYLIFHTVPVFSVSIMQGFTKLAVEEDEMKELFYDEAITSMCELTLRTVYKIRDYSTKDENALFEIAYKSLLNIERCHLFYSKQEATTCFRFLTYTYRDIIGSLKNNPGLVSNFMNREKFFCILMHVISKLITDFEISWTDAFEAVCLIDSCLDYFNFMNWSPKITLKSLKLLKILISKNMTPSMVLLSDQACETPVASVPQILYTKLHEPDWEIRDTALEVLHTLAIMAQDKFPSFQNVIMNSELTPLLITISTKDGESFVRASALKCLQELVKIQEIWTKILEKEKLPEKVIEIFEKEPEAIVRSEAATLMSEMYQHQAISLGMLCKVYEIMYHAAISDLHWEVQVKSLDFWQIVITKQLVNQGMIDGTFPSVTFSKENRKIVTLTEKEIQSRLNKVLKNLSSCGCLAVLLNALEENCDLVVSKKAVEVTKKLVAILREHNIISSSKCESPYGAPTSPFNNFDSGTSSSSRSSSQSDNVINQIVSSHDANLLSGVFVFESELSSSNNIVVRRKIKVVPPSEFLQSVERDLDLLVLERQQWLNKMDDLGSLLNDMLRAYGELDDVNQMDCY